MIVEYHLNGTLLQDNNQGCMEINVMEKCEETKLCGQREHAQKDAKLLEVIESEISILEEI